jgi:phosphatidylethanolamine-binding protein (PEBP) family uncharacterized protein
MTARVIDRLVGCAVACTLAASAPASAHDPTDGAGSLGGAGQASRAWTHVGEGVHWHGSFLAAAGDRVSIQTDAGAVVTVETARLAPADQAYVASRVAAIDAQRGGAPQGGDAAAPAPSTGLPWQAATFAPFAPFVTTRSDERWLYVESDGLPHAPLDHRVMVGIRAWQQQVPLPQPYTGANTWQIPLRPALAERPISGRDALMRGAVAIAANGIPIFNALNNRGVDSFSIGELDEFGGHCGRADDYHYHAAPLAIATIVGPGKPIAFALDGFPIYGLFDPNAAGGSELACPCGSREPLDALNGHFVEVPKGQGFDGGTRSYHYHASKTFPYINGGLRGRVTLDGEGRESQVTPQPRARGVRPALQVLRGARITSFRSTGPKAWSLGYEIDGRPGSVAYAIEADGQVAFEFTTPEGEVTRERYAPERERGGRRRGEENGERPRRRPEPQPDAPPTREPAAEPTSKPPLKPEPSTPAADGFLLTTSGLDARGLLDRRYTCDGEGISPPFAWSGLPRGTTALVLTIHHITPDGDERVYLVLEDIPASTTELRAGERAIGHFGLNSVHRRPEYEPPCSQGPGEKTYVATLSALSKPLGTSATPRTREELLTAIRDRTLGTATLAIKAERQPQKNARPERDRDRPPAATGEERGGLLARMTAFKTDVPARAMDVILARPTERSMTVSVGLPELGRVVVEYWAQGTDRRSRSSPTTIAAGAVGIVELRDLRSGTAYDYRVGVIDAAPTKRDGEPRWEHEGRFRTRVPAGTPFTFVVQADSHLDQGVTPAVYERTLANMRAATPDFLIDLGDTFMTDKRGKDFERSASQYDAQRYYFGLACDVAPLLMVLGNHDGEKGSAGTGESDMGPWSYRMRTSRFPEPLIEGAGDGMYSGRTSFADGRGSHYYAFTWGDAQIIVLDPFWPTTERVRGGGGGNRGGGGGPGGEGGRGAGDGPPLQPTDASWASTLGREQYDWLERTLGASTARYRFVFIHHLVGGVGGTESRGGVESAAFFEWGGLNADGTDGFAERRPGWPMPIHDLLVKHRVSAVFHGHDHLYVHSMKDGIHYQCVPQPGNLGGSTRSAQQYGYASGTLLGSPGHLRVRVGPDAAWVEFVRTAVPDAGGERERGGRGRRAGATEENAALVDRYEIRPAAPSAPKR